MKDAVFWIRALGLVEHPEGGFFSETYRSDELLLNAFLPERYTGPRSFSTSIYFLLKSENISVFHRLQSDEMWHFYKGSSLTIHVLGMDGIYKKIQLGDDIENGEKLQAVIPRGDWFGAEVNEKASFSLTGCTVAPGFDFNDFELGEREEMIRDYPGQAELIKRLTG